MVQVMDKGELQSAADYFFESKNETSRTLQVRDSVPRFSERTLASGHPPYPPKRQSSLCGLACR